MAHGPDSACKEIGSGLQSDLCFYQWSTETLLKPSCEIWPGFLSLHFTNGQLIGLLPIPAEGSVGFQLHEEGCSLSPRCSFCSLN